MDTNQNVGEGNAIGVISAITFGFDVVVLTS